jgi:hypothetical protein
MGAQPQDSWLLDAQPAVGLRHGFASVSMRLFLSVVLPLTAVFVLAFVLEYRAEVRTERARLLTQEAAVIQRGVRWVERELEIATSDLHFIDKHIDELTAIRKGGEELPVELTVCPVMVAGKQLFCGFLRDLSETGRSEAAANPQGASS